MGLSKWHPVPVYIERKSQIFIYVSLTEMFHVSKRRVDGGKKRKKGNLELKNRAIIPRKCLLQPRTARAAPPGASGATSEGGPVENSCSPNVKGLWGTVAAGLLAPQVQRCPWWNPRNILPTCPIMVAEKLCLRQTEKGGLALWPLHVSFHFLYLLNRKIVLLYTFKLQKLCLVSPELS